MGEQDREVWDLTLQLEGLSIRLSSLGVPRHLCFLRPQALHLVPALRPLFRRAPSRWSLRPPQLLSASARLPPGPATGLWAPPPPLNKALLFPLSLPATCPTTGFSPPAGTLSSSSASAVPEHPLPGPCEPSFEQRQRLALSFPQVPDSCVALCRSLQATELTAPERACRAWVAGCWAGAVLRGETRRPDPSPSFSQPSRFYCILRAAGLTCVLITDRLPQGDRG